MTDRMRAFLSSLPLFQTLPEAELTLLAGSIEILEVQPGAVVFRAGEPGDAMFVIESGHLQVMVVQSTGEAHTLATLGPGQIVGEMAVLYGRPRSATVQTASECRLVKIPGSSLERLFAASPVARTRLLDAAGRRLPSLYLASVPMFAGLDVDALRELDLERNWLRLSVGEVLFRDGDPAEEFYVVVRGRLGAASARHPDRVRHLGHGDVVGEVALFAGERRNGTVWAVRDSELIRVDKADAHWLLQHPRGALEMVQGLVHSVRAASVRRPDALASTIAILPVGSGAPVSEWAAALSAAMSLVGGPTQLVDKRHLEATFGRPVPEPLQDPAAQVRVKAWLFEQEERTTFTVFDCGSLSESWTEFSLRHADLVVLVAPPGGGVSDVDVSRHFAPGGPVAPSTPRVLVLLHGPDVEQPTGTAAWLARYAVTRHHHVRVDRPADSRRVARYIAGRANGLALSGGGARTLAHLGVLKALGERGVPVDAIGGVSAGAFAAAYTALGYDAPALERLCLENMNNYSLASDATLPMTSFLSAKNYVRIMRRMFGEVQIEDLWLPFFCLSANLTTASVVVHDRGPLWLALRASTSVPGIHPPVCINGELLVDGGVLNNIPIDVMRERCPGKVIASDVSLTVDLRTTAADQSAVSGWPQLRSRIRLLGGPPPALPHIFEILTRTATLSSTRHAASVARAADLYVRTPTAGVSTLDWNAGVVLFEPARRLALEALDQWDHIPETS
jgi:NTE family protein/lysophospholipid hydrolase